MNVTIVIPVFNEEENIGPLAAELVPLAKHFDPLEVLFVDDGSSDGTWDRICAASRAAPVVTGLRCPVNRGQSSAMIEGLKAARGDILVTMDGDLQNNPADIPKVVAALEDYDVVCGYRATRRDSWSRRAASRIANRVRDLVTHDGVRDTGCSLKAFRRHCVPDLPPVDGLHRFMPAYFRLNGRSIRELAVDHRPRQHGVSKYTNLQRLPRGIFDLVGFLWYRRRYLAPLQGVERHDAN
jgi:dolichol-phosphate mannosyltransferase